MFRKYLITICIIALLPALVVLAQVGANPNLGIGLTGGGGGGGGSSLLTTANTWNLLQTFTSGTSATSYGFTNGTLITEISNGNLKFTDSGGSGFTSLQLGNASNQPKFLTSANIFRLQSVGTVGMSLEFGGTKPSGCNTSAIWSGANQPPQFCTGFASFAYLGPAPIPTNASGGAITPAAPSGGTSAFIFTISGTPSSFTFDLAASQTGNICHATNMTANAANRANQRVVQTTDSTTTITMQNQLVLTGAAQAFAANDKIGVTCFAY